MDLKQLRYFCQTVESGSISAAARECEIAQPSLSQAIRQLEKELGEELLIRKAKGVVPTAAGELLRTHAQRLIRDADKLRLQFEKRGQLQSGSLTFGILPTMAPYLLPRILGPFRTMYPAVTISVSEAMTAELIEKVGNGQLDFAIMSDIPAHSVQQLSLETKLLFEEELQLALPPRHEYISQVSPPSPEDLPTEQLIHLREGHCLTEQTSVACGTSEMKSDLHCDQLSTVIALVGSGMGIAVVPELAARESQKTDVTFRSFPAPVPKRKVQLVTKTGVSLTAATEALMTSLAQAFSRRIA